MHVNIQCYLLNNSISTREIGLQSYSFVFSVNFFKQILIAWLKWQKHGSNVFLQARVHQREKNETSGSHVIHGDDIWSNVIGEIQPLHVENTS